MISSPFWSNAKKLRSKLCLLWLLFFACEVNGPCLICSMACPVKLPNPYTRRRPICSTFHWANQNDPYLYCVDCQVKERGQFSRWAVRVTISEHRRIFYPGPSRKTYIVGWWSWSHDTGLSGLWRRTELYKETGRNLASFCSNTHVNFA